MTALVVLFGAVAHVAMVPRLVAAVRALREVPVVRGPVDFGRCVDPDGPGAVER